MARKAERTLSAQTLAVLLQSGRKSAQSKRSTALADKRSAKSQRRLIESAVTLRLKDDPAAVEAAKEVATLRSTLHKLRLSKSKKQMFIERREIEFNQFKKDLEDHIQDEKKLEKELLAAEDRYRQIERITNERVSQGLALALRGELDTHAQSK